MYAMGCIRISCGRTKETHTAYYTAQTCSPCWELLARAPLSERPHFSVT